MAEATRLVFNQDHVRFLKAYTPPRQETEGDIVGSPADLLIESEPLDLVNLSPELDVPNRPSAQNPLEMSTKDSRRTIESNSLDVESRLPNFSPKRRGPLIGKERSP